MADAIHAALSKLAPRARAQLATAIKRASAARELTYARDDGRTRIIPLLPAPAVFAARDAAYLRGVVATLTGAFVKVATARRTDPEVAALLPVEPGEEEWLALGPPPGQGAPLFARWDMNVALDDVRAAQLFEMNGCAVGGLHYGGVSSEIVHELLADRVPALRLPPSMREVWLAALAEAAGRPAPAVAWLEDLTWEGGITEGPSLVRALDRADRRALVADPRAIAWRGDQLLAAGVPVDLLYRSLELRDLVEIEAGGTRLDGLRAAFARGRVASPPEGDLDHKSLLELWSSPRFGRLFTASERAVFRRHVPWTRLLGARTTEGPDGRTVDLPAYARKHRTRLVLKPNRSCGGDGVLIGKDTPPARWERAIARAVRGTAPAVVQARIDSARIRVPGARHFTTYGLLAHGDALGFLGRAAPFPVVNVARGGYLMGVLFG